MFKLLGLILVLAIVTILILAATKPPSYHVERSIAIAAPTARIEGLTGDFHNWDQWSPWAHLDPNMRTTYSGPRAGPGSVYEWEGNRKVGKGRMEVLSTTPVQTTIKLDFLKPFESHTITNFDLVPDGETTRVTWAMDGPNTPMSKVMSVFTSMDAMIGKDFERGLVNLKAAAER